MGDRCWRGRVWPGAGLGALSLLRVISRDLAIAVVVAQERLAWALSWRTGESFKRGRRARRRSQSAARNWKAGWRAEAGGYFSNFEGTAGAGAEPVGLVARPGGVNVQLSRCGKLLVLRKAGCCRAPHCEQLVLRGRRKPGSGSSLSRSRPEIESLSREGSSELRGCSDRSSSKLARLGRDPAPAHLFWRQSQ